MTEVISLINEKGGVGKSTSCNYNSTDSCYLRIQSIAY